MEGTPSGDANPAKERTPGLNTMQLEATINAASSHNDDLPTGVGLTARLLLCNARQDITSIDAEIKRTSPVPDGLLAHRARLEGQIKSCQLAIAPHRKLPTELLREIFTYEATETFSLPKDSPHEFPSYWHASHVCAKWRRVVLGMHELWSYIQATYDDRSSHRRHLSTTNLVTEILRRTRDCISLAIHVGNLQPSDDFDPISIYLIPNASRLRNLRFDGTLDVLEPFLTLPAGSVEEMNAVGIYFNGPHARYPITVFKGARNLRRFWLEQDERDVIDVLPFHFPLTQLTALSLWAFSIPPSNALVLLQHCVALESCSLRSVGKWQQSELPPQSSIVCPRMKFLNVALREANETGHWLGAFLFPCLIGVDIFGPWDSVLVNVVTGSKCLEQLKLDMPIPATDMEAILRQSQLLQDLNLTEASLPRTALAVLSHGEYVPMLKILLSIVTEENLDDHFDMLESRRLALCPDIETVIWQLETNDRFYGKEREDQLNSDGWNIAVCRYKPYNV